MSPPHPIRDTSGEATGKRAGGCAEERASHPFLPAVHEAGMEWAQATGFLQLTRFPATCSVKKRVGQSILAYILMQIGYPPPHPIVAPPVPHLSAAQSS